MLDADAGSAQPIATFDAAELETMLQGVVGQAPSNRKRLVIANGQSAIAFMLFGFNRRSHIPDRLLHAVTTSYAAEEGVAISTHHTKLQVLGPPLEGSDWTAPMGQAMIKTIITGGSCDC